jgi:hypothetical protein
LRISGVGLCSFAGSGQQHAFRHARRVAASFRGLRDLARVNWGGGARSARPFCLREDDQGIDPDLVETRTDNVICMAFWDSVLFFRW